MISHTVVALTIPLFHAVPLINCSRCPLDNDNSATVHQCLEVYVDSIDVIDTHEYQRIPPGINISDFNR